MKSSDEMKRIRALSRAIINILAKGDNAAERLLMDIHKTVPNDLIFYGWCRLAERQGLVGPKLVELREQLGSVGDTIFHVFRTDIKTMSCPAERVRQEIVIDKLRPTITW